MNRTATAESDVPVATRPDRRAADPTRRGARSSLLVIGLAVVGFALLVAVFAPLLTAYDPHVVSGPILEQPSARHWLGTDVPGRDIFSQLLYGTRASLIAAGVGGSLAIVGAIVIGVLPALRRGFVDTFTSRLVVFLLAVPAIPLLVTVGSLARSNQTVLLVMIAYIGIAPISRILRGQVLALRDRGFISAARGFGGSPLYVLRRHIVPAMGPLVLVNFVNWASVAVGLQAALAFLGLGSASAVSWGAMINRAESQQAIYTSPMWKWWVLPPGVAITLTLVGFTFIGVGLEPRFNPRWGRTS